MPTKSNTMAHQSGITDFAQRLSLPYAHTDRNRFLAIRHFKCIITCRWSPAITSRVPLSFRVALGAKAAPGYVVHPGHIELPLAAGVAALPFALL